MQHFEDYAAKDNADGDDDDDQAENICSAFLGESTSNKNLF